MNVREAIKQMMKARRLDQWTVARGAGFKNQSNLSEMLRGTRNMRVDNLLKIANAMGCEVTLRSTRRIDDPETGREYYPAFTLTLDEGSDEAAEGGDES